MSSPTRQVANRRLPPLAGSKSSANSRKEIGLNSGSSTKSPAGYRGTDLQLNLADGPFRPALVTAKPLNERVYNGKQPKPVVQQEIDGESVRTFLQLNPQFLDDYVMKSVDQERLERWLIRKTRKDKKNTESLDSNSQDGESHRPSLSKWKFCVHADKKKMLEELTNDVHHLPNKEKVLTELVNCIASACHADGFSLYIVDTGGKEMYQNNPNQPGSRTSLTIQIKDNSTVAGFVGTMLKPVRVTDILEDARFPDGIGMEGSTAQSVLCQPIVQSNGELVGVVELTRTLGNEPFGEEDEEIVNSYLVWGGIALYYSEMYHSMHRHRKLSEFLLNVTRSIFQDIISMDTVIMKIMNYAQTLVDADRTSLFLVDSRTNELYARIFDVGGRMADSTNLKKEIRFPKSKGVAGYVATTGETLNILDAYHDGRFNREIDLQTGYTTKTLLCMPIFIRGNIIGVVQMVNKKSGVFTRADEQSFQTFAIYCGLALHHAKLYDKIRRSEQKYKVALEVLSYHSMCNEQEIGTLKQLLDDNKNTYPGIDEYEFNPYDVEWTMLPKLVIEMFANLFSMQKCRSINGDQMKTVPTSRLRDSLNSRFDVDELVKFTLTVRKNYRRVPYHNWTHAFNVAHCMYNVIQKSNGQFNSLESLALYVACICHDLDHRGRTNSWMKMEGTPLAAVYTTSTMEHHHFNQTITILQHEGHNIFSHLSSVEYKAVLGFIKDCILATDLALFFGNKGKLKDLLDTNKFNWDTMEHRKLVHAISMTACDLSACTKPWNIQYETVKVIFQEFYAEGDEQKAQGRQPIPMMDRDTAHELPAHQVGFLVGICLPCYELLWRCMPGTKPLLDGAKTNLQHWSELVAKQKKEAQANKEKMEQAEKTEAKTDSEKKTDGQKEEKTLADEKESIQNNKIKPADK